MNLDEKYDPDDPKTYYRGRTHAARYQAYRLPLPDELVAKIVASVQEKFGASDLVGVDVGCGSGQATLPLAPFFASMSGVDPSAAQIGEALKQPHAANVRFVVAEAEHLPFEDNSVHLVCTRNALHWFKMAEFFAEVDRILAPGATLAVTCGGKPSIVGIDRHQQSSMSEVFTKYNSGTRNERVKLVLNHYKDVQMPYPSERQVLVSEAQMSVKDVVGFWETHAGFAALERDDPQEAQQLIQGLRHKVMTWLGKDGKPEETLVETKATNTLIICRKPEN